ncbi:MAG: cytochrome c family protein [Actinobacteria bacterium]|nr:cytochrome c family protein [Actinomycetota bacterium]
MAGPRRSAREFAKEFTCFRWRALGAAVAAGVIAAVLAVPAMAATTTTTPATTATSAPATTATKDANSGTPQERCLICHGQEYLGTVTVSGSKKNLYIPPDGYNASAHGVMPCNACHIGFSHDDPHKMVTNVEFFAQTARESCRNCHDGQYEMYKQSYHGTLTREQQTNGKAPGCVDCHGTHEIQKVQGLKFKQSVADMCGKCHAGREGTFLDTYHGKAILLGREAVATCVDCHGSHSILPVSNPDSALSKANILGTCQKCHPKAGPKFTTFLVHIQPTSPKAPKVVFAVSIFYLVMIAVVFLFGGIHTLLYIYRGLKDGLYFKRGGH